LKRSFLEFALPPSSRQTLDLLEKLLTPEVRDRISAGEALLHPFLGPRG
jgi:serine/threonine protein kinase